MLYRINGRPQLLIQTEESLRSVSTLEPIYWVANSVPTKGISCDTDFLQALDHNKDQRISPKDIHFAIHFLSQRLVSLTPSIEQSTSISLDNFQTKTSEGSALYALANLILQNISSEATRISLSDVRAKSAIFKAGAMNGDGIIPPSVLANPEQQSFLSLGLTLFDGTLDLNGERGLSLSEIEQIVPMLSKFGPWQQDCPLENWNPQMCSIVDKCTPFIEAHFIDFHQTVPSKERIPSEIPLSALPPSAHLTPTLWVHPNYRQNWQQLWDLVLAPLNLESLGWQEWVLIQHQSHVYQNWLKACPNPNLSKLPSEQIQQWLDHPEKTNEVLSEIKGIIQQDLANATHLSQLNELETLLLLQQHIVPFLNSFVNFSAFYNPQMHSMPEYGSLLMDGRLFRLVVWVDTVAEHKKRAQDSGFFLLYVKVAAATPYTVGVAVTGKERGDLHIGKQGIFFDHKGTEFAATVFDTLDNPINIREAFLEPLLLGRDLLFSKFKNITQQQKESIQKTPTVEDSQRNSQLWMTGGVTFAALSSSLAYVVQTIASINLWSIAMMMFAPMFLLGILSSIRAGWRLHSRNLGPILEASGWGINHPIPAPDWAANIFTHHPDYDKQAISPTQDLLLGYEKVVDPYGQWKRWLLSILGMVFLGTVWYLWEDIQILIQITTPKKQ